MKRLLVGGAVLALGIGSMGISQAAPFDGYKVNGGGQVLLDGSEPGGGPGDTVAFTARQVAPTNEEPSAAQGQFQYVERDGAGPGVAIHGTVTCLRVDGTGRAIIEGTLAEREEDTTFRVDVEDAGRGAQGEDIVTVTFPNQDNDCKDEAKVDDDFRLARGNVTIHEPRS